MTNLYAILDVPPSVSPAELKAAFRGLAIAHHPDRNNGRDERFKEISAAYEVLSSEATRKAYDAEWLRWLRERGAFPCEGCGWGVRVPAGASGRLRCHICKREFVVQARDGNKDGLKPSSMMDAVAATLRRHGERLGNQVLVETSAIAEQITDEMVTEAATAAARGIRSGLARLRERLGVPQDREPRRERKRSPRTKEMSPTKE